MQSRVTEYKIMAIATLYYCKHTGDMESTKTFWTDIPDAFATWETLDLITKKYIAFKKKSVYVSSIMRPLHATFLCKF